MGKAGLFFVQVVFRRRLMHWRSVALCRLSFDQNTALSRYSQEILQRSVLWTGYGCHVRRDRDSVVMTDIERLSTYRITNALRNDVASRRVNDLKQCDELVDAVSEKNIR